MNTTTGNFVEREVDLGFTGGLASLGFARTYNSVLDGVGALGPGWASCADERLVLDEEGARWVRPSGRHVVFPRLGTGWERATGDALWLGSSWVLWRVGYAVAGAAAVVVVWLRW